MFECNENAAKHLIPLPELHLLIGIVNLLYEHMLFKFRRESEDWVKERYVSGKVNYSKPLFNANFSRKLLKNVDVLKRITEKYGVGYEVLGTFRKV